MSRNKAKPIRRQGSPWQNGRYPIQPCYAEDLKWHEPCKSSCLLSGNFPEIKHFLFDFTDKFITQDRLAITCYITIFFGRIGKRKDFRFQCLFIDSIIIYLRRGKTYTDVLLKSDVPKIKYRDENNKWIVAVKEHAKTDSGNRDLIISSTALDTLNQILKPNTSGTYLFEHNGKRIRGNTFNKRLSRICNELHIPHRTMHKIRKAWCRWGIYYITNGTQWYQYNQKIILLQQ